MNRTVTDGRRRPRLWWCLLALTTTAFADGGSAQHAHIADSRGMPVGGIILVATLRPTAVPPGEPGLLDVKARNGGQKPQHFVESNPLSDVALIVQDDKGKQVPVRLAAPQDFGVDVVELLPEQDLVTAYPVTAAYGLTRPGHYRIAALRKVYIGDGDRATEVVSNTTVLTVSSSLSKDFALSCSAGGSAVARGRPAVLHVSLKNVSSKGKTVLLGGALGGYDLTVQDFRGDVMHSKRAVPPEGKGPVARALPAGGSADTDIDLSRDYDLTKGPRYFITAMHNVPGEKGTQRQVYSNTVVLTLAP